nr:NnrS family protein [Gammaproteobacteria bacterium]
MSTGGINIDRRQSNQAEIALLVLGFRPFFLLAASFAVVQVGIWLGFYVGRSNLATYYSGTLWHGHEMIFGYTTAVIAGFLLTAVPNWTGLSTPQGKPLAALATLWVAGRVLPFFPESSPHWFIAVVDIAFLPVLTGLLAIPVMQARQRRNFIFLLLLGTLAIANVVIHLEILGAISGAATTAIYLAINLIVVLIAIMGGRVIPFFAERALPGFSAKRWPAVEAVAFAGLILLTAAQLVYPDPMLIGMLGTLTFLSHALRLSGWYTHRIWKVPILWILYLGYGWLVLGFALTALAMLGAVSSLLALHAFTVGGIGVLTFGMMARVALGHTGRAMKAANPLVMAFVLLNLAAVTRVLLPIAFPTWHIYAISASGLLWMLAFSIFTYLYAPILWSPRADVQQQEGIR